MKRDWEIIKQLLFKFRDDTIIRYLEQEIDEKPGLFALMSYEDRQKAEQARQKRNDLILEHIKLMLEDGLVSGIEVVPYLDGYAYQIKLCPRLTSLGQSFCESLEVTGEDFWAKVVKTAKTDALPITMDLIRRLFLG